LENGSIREAATDMPPTELDVGNSAKESPRKPPAEFRG
jgi:hypothetical protein